MIEKVPLEKLKIRENRIRSVIGDLTELMVSMSEVGLLNPLTIDEDYCVIEGTRRYNSAKNLGWSKIRCDKRIGLSEYQKLTIEIDENLRRKNLNPAEEAKALALKKRFFLKRHPEYKRGGDRKSQKFKEFRQDQSATSAFGFAKTQAKELGASERTIKTKTKIGEFILDEKLKDRTVDQFSKRKISQRKVLEEIKAIERDSQDYKQPTEKSDPKNQEPQKVIELIKVKTPTKPKQKPLIIVELDEEDKNKCKDCKKGLQLTCPNCKDAFISCQQYKKNPYLRRLDSNACENYQ